MPGTPPHVRPVPHIDTLPDTASDITPLECEEDLFPAVDTTPGPVGESPPDADDFLFPVVEPTNPLDQDNDWFFEEFPLIDTPDDEDDEDGEPPVTTTSPPAMAPSSPPQPSTAPSSPLRPPTPPNAPTTTLPGPSEARGGPPGPPWDSTPPPVLPGAYQPTPTPTSAPPSRHPRHPWLIPTITLTVVALLITAWQLLRPTTPATPHTSPSHTPATISPAPQPTQAAPPDTAWTWTPRPADIVKPTPLGLVVLRDTTLLLIPAHTGTETTLTHTTGSIDALATIGTDTIAWATTGTLHRIHVDTTPLPDVAIPDNATLFTAGNGLAAGTDHTIWLLHDNQFQPIPIPAGATILGVDSDRIYARMDDTTLTVIHPDSTHDTVTLTPPDIGWIPTTIIAAGWGHTLSLWEHPQHAGLVAAVHDGVTGDLLTAATTTHTWENLEWGEGRMSVSSAGDIAWLAPTTPTLCSIGTTGIIASNLGSAATVSTATGPVILTPTCHTIASDASLATATPNGDMLIWTTWSGQWTATPTQQ